MRFGRTLRNSIYEPWKDQYVDYAKLKTLLREDGAQEDDKPWTEDDEGRFCDETFTVQLEKVGTFQESTLQNLEQRAAKINDTLREFGPEGGKDKAEATTSRFKEIEAELDSITNEMNELKKYSMINHTALRKIVKKHDRKRGNRYNLRPLLQINLAKRPFNSEQVYNPLLNKLSVMYFVVRQHLEDAGDKTSSTAAAEAQSQTGERYTSYEFWVHPDNLLEVKTYIMRRLPVLVYSQQAAKQLDVAQNDPTITSLYFDSQQFSLYSQQVGGVEEKASLRLRWFGQLSDRPDLFLEKKVAHSLKDGISEEKRFTIKEKYIHPFITGEYRMEKSIQKLERQGQPAAKVEDYKHTVGEIQEFIEKNDLQPVIRATYTRTAFQKPLDDRVRISIDTKLCFIREDTLDSSRPCRNPDDWHRADVDNSRMEYPYSNIHRGEISRFPFAVLEIKVKDEGSRKTPQWIQDLMASHLVYDASGFSKFTHGVASLFEDYVNVYPPSLSEIETEIRRDPHEAHAEEEKAKAQRAEDELLVGSFVSGNASNRRISFKPAVSSPLGKSYLTERLAAEESQISRAMSDAPNGKGKNRDAEEDEDTKPVNGYDTFRSAFPSFSISRYAKSRRGSSAKLPPGVTKPGQLIKDSGPLQVEPKVWLANERTYLKWQQICVFLGALSLTLYNAAGKNAFAAYMGITYVVIAAFAGMWGYYMYLTRRKMIIARSGKDFDNFVGPIVIAIALMAALLLNLTFTFQSAFARLDKEHGKNGTTKVNSGPDGRWTELVR